MTHYFANLPLSNFFRNKNNVAIPAKGFGLMHEGRSQRQRDQNQEKLHDQNRLLIKILGLYG